MKKFLIFIVAYNAESTIESVCRRIPEEVFRIAETEVLIIDDMSQDDTFLKAKNCSIKTDTGTVKPRVLQNYENLGYGGNQKVGYKYAIDYGFDYVALLHGDGQYAPELLPELLKTFFTSEAGAVFGSRMLSRGDALKGGMPLYKYAGNRILTTLQNILLGLNLSEFHTGYRLYSIDALKGIPFQLNTNDFHFDTEIIIQLKMASLRIVEKPIPTFYGDEVCHVNGFKYALDVVKASIAASLQNYSIFYDIKYDCKPKDPRHYQAKSHFDSTHTLVKELVKGCSNILDIGCGPGHVAGIIRRDGVRVTGVDQFKPVLAMDAFIQHNLDNGLPDLDYSEYDAILLLDVLEHLKSPDSFLLALHESGLSPNAKVIVSTANVAFILTRASLFFGMFNYGKRGILDMTHNRLFTLSSLKKLLKQTNFVTQKTDYVPVPFPLAIGDNIVAAVLLKFNSLLIRILPRLFSFQYVICAHSKPSLKVLLNLARSSSDLEQGQP